MKQKSWGTWQRRCQFSRELRDAEEKTTKNAPEFENMKRKADKAVHDKEAAVWAAENEAAKTKKLWMEQGWLKKSQVFFSLFQRFFWKKSGFSDFLKQIIAM